MPWLRPRPPREQPGEAGAAPGASLSAGLRPLAASASHSRCRAAWHVLLAFKGCLRNQSHFLRLLLSFPNFGPSSSQPQSPKIDELQKWVGFSLFHSVNAHFLDSFCCCYSDRVLLPPEREHYFQSNTNFLGRIKKTAVNVNKYLGYSRHMLVISSLTSQCYF